MTSIKSYIPSLKANDKEIVFEAHYWGSFQLLDLQKNHLNANKGKIPIAIQKGFGLKQKLLLDTKDQSIFLANNLNRPIAYEIDEFLGPPNINADQITANQLYFDKRKRLEELLPPDLYILTGIHDPEYFEEIENYIELIHQFSNISNGQLKFDEIKGIEKEGLQKELHLKYSDKEWKIVLNKELFDNQLIIDLNRILKDIKIEDYSFATTINENMEMVLLKLSANQYQLLERMGLLI